MLKETFDEKSSHNKINDNYIIFLIRRMVSRTSKSQRGKE